jgi:hypothetical protein
MFWVPQNGSIGVGISILSYNGNVHFGLIADAKLVADPESVVQRFAGEFEKLVLATLMEDWDGDLAAADAEATYRRFAAETVAQTTATKPSRSTAKKTRAAAPRAAAARASGSERTAKSGSERALTKAATPKGGAFGDELKRFRRRIGG